MKPINKKTILIPAVPILFLLVLLALFCSSRSFQNPQEVNTTNKNRDWHVNYLNKRISSIQSTNEGVRITGRLFQSSDIETRTVPIGYKFTFTGHHDSKVYTIAKIQDDGIVIDYESTFDHSSFGKKLIERDTGSFKVAWSKDTSNTCPANTTLPEAIDAWVTLIEADNPSEAARWCQNEEAKQQMLKWWDALKRCHQQYDYRKWIRDAKDLKNLEKFTVGGHSFGHMHTIWEPTAEGWRISRVLICR